MRMNFRLSAVVLTAALLQAVPAISQRVYYNPIDMSIKVPPAYPQYASYTSYDVALIPYVVAADKRVKYDSLPYEIKVGNLKKSAAGDFHVVANLSMLSGKLTSKSTASLNVRLGAKVFDKVGNLVYEGTTNRDGFYISLGRKLADEETDNQVLVNTLLIQNCIDTALAGFNRAFAGGSFTKEIYFAALTDVKKFPELKEFKQQLDELIPVIAKKEQAAINEKLETYVPYWEKMTAYAGEGEVNDVKRAAYQNLIITKIFTGKTDKLDEYTTAYKAIDKVESLAFGLLKMKHSEDGEKLLKLLGSVAAPAGASTVGKEVTLAELVETETFLVIDHATITFKGDKTPGVFTGKISIAKTPVEEDKSLVLLAAKKKGDMVVEAKDAAGNSKPFNATSSDIEFIKTASGDQYIYRVFGSTLGVGGTGTILKSSYSSDKITVFRAVLPAGNEYFIAKAGDKEGFAYSILKGKKKLIQYFADCPDMEEKFKNKTISDDATIEQIAAIYTQCK